MAGTALVAATMLVAGGAMAAEKKMMKPSISVNGYYQSVVGGIFDEERTGAVPDTSALDVRTDAEVHFNGRATLENGLKIHTRWELEGGSAHSNSDIIDEYFCRSRARLGRSFSAGRRTRP